MASSFVAELAHRLQGLSLALPLTWIEQRLSESELTIEQVVHAENQQQAADQVSISNSIGSLRVLGATDWRKFVESVSAVEAALREDPAGVYRGMDFATRDRYRRTVEAIARRSPLAESEVARQAIRLAQTGTDTKATNAREHVGFYLIDQGLPQLERAAHVQRFHRRRLARTERPIPLAHLPGRRRPADGDGHLRPCGPPHADGQPGWMLAVVGLLAALCAGQLAVALVNWLATVLATPHLLPRMDFSGGIPPQSRALVVIPTMLSSAAEIADLVEALEVRFLANRDDNLRFGLLTDLPDANEETPPEDEALVSLAKTKIEELNAKYGSPEYDPFLLFHRPRRFNPRERLWMGYERKRGKLAELNALLRGRGLQADFSLVVGNLAGLQQVQVRDHPRHRYAVAARRRPATGRRHGPPAQPGALSTNARNGSVAGYGILQPRMAVSLASANRSRFAQLWGSEPGLDPYTRAVSDVYQDLFQEGSFIGKGIYDVDAFERALAGRFPENRILSHDLLEGCYARSGLVTDVQLYEEYPARYRADVSRRHRWIRGDWQIARWLLPWVPVCDPARALAENPLSLLSRWKIFDNLRRSLVPVAATALLLLGWTSLPRPWFWTLALLAMLLIPPAAASLLACSQARGRAARAAPGRIRPLDRRALRPGGICLRLPALRGLVQPRCHRAHGLPGAGQPPAAAGMESVS